MTDWRARLRGSAGPASESARQNAPPPPPTPCAKARPTRSESPATPRPCPVLPPATPRWKQHSRPRPALVPGPGPGGCPQGSTAALSTFTFEVKYHETMSNIIRLAFGIDTVGINTVGIKASRVRYGSRRWGRWSKWGLGGSAARPENPPPPRLRALRRASGVEWETAGHGVRRKRERKRCVVRGRWNRCEGEDGREARIQKATTLAD